MSADPEASKQFYTQAIGWGTRADRPLLGAEGRPPYTMWMAGATPIGGLVPFSEDYWLGYVAVADVGRSVAQARDLGGEVIFEPYDIPNVGSFAVIQDRHGAAIAVFRSAEDSAPSQPYTPNLLEFSWHELATTDYRAALDFYKAMFEWETISEEDMGPLGIYVVFGRNGVPYGGMFNKPPETAAAWCYYVRVQDVRDAAGKVLQNGGQVLTEPMEVPGGDRIAKCRDTGGGMFALHQKAR
jgi:predicted enzyme related to lactoylglutathione lyase